MEVHHCTGAHPLCCTLSSRSCWTQLKGKSRQKWRDIFNRPVRIGIFLENFVIYFVKNYHSKDTSTSIIVSSRVPVDVRHHCITLTSYQLSFALTLQVSFPEIFLIADCSYPRQTDSTTAFSNCLCPTVFVLVRAVKRAYVSQKCSFDFDL